MGFIHFHVHSEFSPDGLSKITNLVDVAKQKDFKYLTLTDHGTLSGIPQFYNACKNNEIVPIFGNEIYIGYGEKADGKPYVGHLTILSLNEIGYNNLINLTNASHTNLIKRRNGNTPVVTFDMLKEFNEGLVCLTGCPASPIHQNNFNFGYKFTEQLLNIFGYENLYAELMFPIPQEDFHSRPFQIASELGIDYVITNDVHFPEKHQYELHTILANIRNGYDYNSKQLYLASEQEMKDLTLKHLTDVEWEASLNAMQRIADRVEIVNIESEPKLPHIDTALLEQFEADLFNALQFDVADLTDEEMSIRVDRFNLEMEVIKGKGFLDYFYIVNDIFNYCNNNNIKMTCRGSGAGSYIVYLMGISDVDPIYYGLLFERFLNYEREDYPDLDLDIEAIRRDEIVQYANDKWSMLPISTFGTYSHKSLVRDLAKYLHLDSLLSSEAAEFGPDSEQFAKLNETNGLFGQAYELIIGQMKYRGKHAGGVASVTRAVPVENWSGTQPQISFAEGLNKELSKVGLVKLDLLGVNVLDKLARMERLTGKKPPLKYTDYPVEVFDLLRSGKLTGLFQIDASSGIRQLSSDVSLDSFEDIIAVAALYRPGTLKDCFHELFYKSKHNLELNSKDQEHRDKISSIIANHPDLAKVLNPTYGVVLYQEQMMQVFATVSGEGVLGADAARKILSPKSPRIKLTEEWQNKYKKLKKKFYNNSLNNGYSKDEIEYIWAMLEAHTGYSFNKAHSASYAALGLKMAWYKTFYPVEYYTALLQVDKGTMEHLVSYLYSMIKENPELIVVSPNVNISDRDYVVHDNKLYLPLGLLKGMGDKKIDKFLEIRNEYGPFATIEQFEELVPKGVMNTKTRELAYRSGFFDGLDGYEKPKLSEVKKAEIEAYGFIVPTQKIVSIIESQQSETQICGIVSSKLVSNSKSGNKLVKVRTVPDGFYWYWPNEEQFNVNEGEVVLVKKNSFGKCLDVKKLV